MDIVIKWNFFEKDTIGKQMVRAADSIPVILLKAMTDIFIKKVNNFISIQGAQFRKRKPGCQNVKEEQ